MKLDSVLINAFTPSIVQLNTKSCENHVHSNFWHNHATDYVGKQFEKRNFKNLNLRIYTA